MIERTVGGLHAFTFKLLERLPAEHRSSILDIGCGTGAWLNRTKVLGFERIIGIDYVQPHAIPGMQLRQFDINRDSFAELGKFDVVSCIEVIEHIENLGNLLDLIKAALNQKGMAIITTPNVESLRARLRALLAGKFPSFDEKGDPTHLCPILHDSLAKMLHKRGLTIDEVHQYPGVRSGSMMFSAPINWIANCLRVVLPDLLYGDNCVYLVRTIGQAQDV